MDVLKYPHPSLFVKCSSVLVFGPELKMILSAMKETMVTYNGIGLAANQVGIRYRLFVMADKNDKYLSVINPIIISRSSVPANLKEGCLSAPGEILTLSERASWVQVKFQDETGKSHVRVFKDIYSVCIQHEIDHLDGKSHLQSSSIPRAKRKLLAKKWGFKLK